MPTCTALSMRSAPTIVLELRVSRALRLGLLAVAVLALLAVVSTGVPTALRVALAMAVLAAAATGDACLRGVAGLRLTLAPEGDWHLVTAAGAAQTLRQVHSAEVGPLIALALRAPDGKVRRLALLPDSADRGDLRRLRVWLRHAHGEPRKAPASMF